jgi:sulfite reductase beta subunit-like hemoprotein
MTILDLPADTAAPLVAPEVTDPGIRADIEKFRAMLNGYQAGDVDEDVFRVFRLTNGIYGQRQGGTNHMVRVRVPYGAVTPEQLDALAMVVERYSRGWGHITTRQNLQMHFVQLEQIPEVLEHLGAVGLTSREACGDTVRNVQGCHLAGACPFEVLDISAWAEAANNLLLRNPIGQRLARKFKINFSGCEADCGQAMFNDAGVIAVTRTLDDGTIEAGFRVYVAGGLGANPHAALALEEFTPRELLLPTIESILRVFEQTGNRDNKLRARMKWVIDELGFEEVQRRVLAQRHLLPASSSWPGGIPAEVVLKGDAPAGRDQTVEATAVGQGVSVAIGGSSPYGRWETANVVRGTAKSTVSAYAWCRLGDITADQFRGMAQIIREFGVDVRVSNRQNFVVRDLAEAQLPALFERLEALDMAAPGAELSRDVVSCPGADTCGLAVTQSRGLADAIGEALETEGLAEVGGVRINISGCMNSCGQHHIADIGFFGTERRAHGEPAPGYQMLLGGYVGQEKIHFGDKALRLPAKTAAEATVRVLRRFVDERSSGEAFRAWMERVGGASEIAKGLKDLDEFPTPTDDPSFYVDYDETGPYVAEIGVSECAT